LAVVCSGCGGALGAGARFCSSCGAAAPKASQEPVAATRGAGGLLGRTMLGDAPAQTSQTVTRRPAEERSGVEATTVRGLAPRRTTLARQPLPPTADAASREELLTPLLADEATARPRQRGGLARLLGGRHGR
jgi:hypothetical protein